MLNMNFMNILCNCNISYDKFSPSFKRISSYFSLICYRPLNNNYHLTHSLISFHGPFTLIEIAS